MLSKIINKTILMIGILCAWLILGMISLVIFLIIARYAFNATFIPLQEIVMVLHCLVFLLGGAYVLQVNRHVRIDVFYQSVKPKTKLWINVCGNIFFLQPFCWIICYFSFSYVYQAWIHLEGSPEAGGIPGYFLLKTLIPLSVLLMSLQGIAILLKDIDEIKK